MNINEYEKKTRDTLVESWTNMKINDKSRYLNCLALGLVCESGEVAGKLAKITRDADGIMSDDDKVEINKELGDVLWFMARIAEETDSSIEEIAGINLEKVLSRIARGKLGGSGDNR